MNETKSETTLSEHLLNIETHGFSIIKALAIPSIILYFGLHPQSAAIFLIEYFKLDPTVAILTIQIAFPVLFGIAFARMLSIYWLMILRYVLAYTVVAILLPFIWILRYVRSQLVDRFLEWIDTVSIKHHSKEKKQRNLLISNQILAVFLMLVLFIAQFFNNSVGHLWNPKFNRELLIITNLHYYCQMTGNYNNDECNKWKMERSKYNSKPFTQTPKQ